VLLILSDLKLAYAGAMALTSAQRIALTVSFFGLLSFLLGVIAENKKVHHFTD
jgi:hypothetical protein